MPLREKSRQGWVKGDGHGLVPRWVVANPFNVCPACVCDTAKGFRGNWIDFNEKCEKQKKCKEAAARQLISIFLGGREREASK